MRLHFISVSELLKPVVIFEFISHDATYRQSLGNGVKAGPERLAADLSTIEHRAALSLNSVQNTSEHNQTSRSESVALLAADFHHITIMQSIPDHTKITYPSTNATPEHRDESMGSVRDKACGHMDCQTMDLHRPRQHYLVRVPG